MPASGIMDLDRVRAFLAAAEAGSFTKAGASLHLSQSAVSRQVAALEADLGAPLFHRHARGLLLTEPGDTLRRAARSALASLDAAAARIADSREAPEGELRVTTTRGLGSRWLAPRLPAFLDQFPAITVTLILDDEELDLSMREADVALRLRRPVQGELIGRRLFTVHFHAYAGAGYLASRGHPRRAADLDGHRLLAFGGGLPPYLADVNWHLAAGREGGEARGAALVANTVAGLARLVKSGGGIAVLPDYVTETGLVRVLEDEVMPSMEAYLAYPEEVKAVARVRAFRDFVLARAQEWEH